MLKSVITLLLLTATFTITAQSDRRLKGLEKELNEILKATGTTGFSIAIVEKDKLLYSKGFGYSDYENKVPADANTLFAIGSCSKAFTASVLGQLSDEGKLTLDDSPRLYIPELKFFNDEMNNSIIIRDLMSHRTGIPRHDYSWYFFPSTDKDSLMRRIEFQEPFAGVREKWYYNNFMYLTQGVIAERITGKTWEENIQERFFTPLKMTRSNLHIAELEKSTNAAFGYSVDNDGVVEKMDYYKIAGMAPAGSINSSVNEMSNWLITWINDGKFKGEQILPESYVQEAMTSQMVINGALPSNEYPDIHLANYGLAWMLSSYKGHYQVEHGGAIDGFRASTVFYPSDSIGIVILSNQNGSPVPDLARKIIADRMLGTEKTDWLAIYNKKKAEGKEAQKKAKENVEKSKSNGPKSAHSSIDFIGTYNHLGYGTFEIVIKNDSLFANFPLTKIYLRNKYYDVFEMFEVSDSGIDTTDETASYFNFSTNDAGEISSANVNMEPSINHPIEFKRTPKTIDVDKSTLESYVGEYEVMGMTVKVSEKSKTLFLFVPGQPEYEMIATEKHKFSFKTLDGFKLEFIEDEDQSIKELKMIQPNGTFVAKKK
jgi:CubicO group peptidase (beta-lactamase class C family)